MKQSISPNLRKILAETERETIWYRGRQSIKRLKLMAKDAPPVLPFRQSLASSSGLIAEIKEQSPSQGRMLQRNVIDAPLAYKHSRVVKAISVLTNRTNFGQGMKIERLLRTKELASKPILRKDFVTDEYQVYQARAFGADAILLMANVLERDEMRRLSDLAFEIGLDVLFETHSAKELDELPDTAVVIGINCRNFEGNPRRFKVAKFWRQWLGVESDKSINIGRFDYASDLPSHAIKVAESGVTSRNCAEVISMGFHCALVGTSLLMDPRGVRQALSDFEVALGDFKKSSPAAAASEHSLTPALA
jgi:indole-3-glycerol phosphate synthase